MDKSTKYRNNVLAEALAIKTHADTYLTKDMREKQFDLYIKQASELVLVNRMYSMLFNDSKSLSIADAYTDSIKIIDKSFDVNAKVSSILLDLDLI